jgi:hypothetical protein
MGLSVFLSRTEFDEGRPVLDRLESECRDSGFAVSSAEGRTASPDSKLCQQANCEGGSQRHDHPVARVPSWLGRWGSRELLGSLVLRYSLAGHARILRTGGLAARAVAGEPDGAPSELYPFTRAGESSPALAQL